jgi:5-methyltetrahydrofolate--homocysteine methyltransferase
MEKFMEKIIEVLTKGDQFEMGEIIQSYLKQGIMPEKIMKEGLIGGMTIIGDKFKRNEIFLPEVMIAARAMNAALSILDPLLSSAWREEREKVILGTVHGDLHDIGKNIVSMMFRGAGFKVIDIGIDVSEEKFINAVKEHHPDILGLSALLTMTLPMMKTTVEAIKKANLHQGLIIMVGGAPVTSEFAEQIGADGYAPEAASAVSKAKDLLKDRSK